MITDDFDVTTEPLLSLKDFYGEAKHLIDKCLIIFSEEIYNHLLNEFECTEIGTLTEVDGCRTIYKFHYKNQEIGFYLSRVASALASSLCYESHWVTGATKYIMFGSCGSLDGDKTKGKFVVPTEAYRGEGASYYYAKPADYISVKNGDKVAKILDELKVPYVKGRVWTTDCMPRETVGLVSKRRNEGCVAVDMELAGVQAVCDFYGLELYDFLEPGDVLADASYEVEGLHGANHNLGKLYIGLDLALRV